MSTAFLETQQMIAQWPKTVSNVDATGQLQKFQHVEGRLFEFGVVCIFGCRYVEK